MTINILLVDSNPDDAQYIKTLFNKTDHPNTVYIANTGNDALDVLHQRGDHSDTPFPDFVILNPHLPQIEGYKILEEIKNTSELKLTPVIVLSESEEAEDITKSYTLSANAHIKKPAGPDKLKKIIAAVEAFWINTAQLPSVK
ncbi:response regulator [Natrinema zhouii]|uniref:Response regulator n=1 Tax=Natrinema zhouii TaxID=1710539 RepID=A0A7D6CPR6_9EURY|nr:response regulator [Natrinema zhouii]QLK26738.1 response regulator [Natrinema zhouii]